MTGRSDVIALNIQREYYDEYWRTHALHLIPDEVLRLAEILKAIALVMPSFKGRSIKICDLGSGRGWLSAELAKFGSVTAVDLSTEAVRVASERWPEVQFSQADILNWRPEESFDLVVTSEVIEHVPDHNKFRQTVSHLLRNGGYVILTTPNGSVKKAWDIGNQGHQIIENWLTLKQLSTLFSACEVLSHKVFILDFSYVGLFRFTSAPKLLKLLSALGLIRTYDFVREMLGLGLYQIFVGKFHKNTQ